MLANWKTTMMQAHRSSIPSSFAPCVCQELQYGAASEVRKDPCSLHRDELINHHTAVVLGGQCLID